MNIIIFKKSIAAGICIGIASTAYLSCNNRIVGAFLFAIGLLIICTYGLELYTGKIGYVIQNKNCLDCISVWFGNLIGTFLSIIPIRITNSDLRNIAINIITDKPLDIFPLLIRGIFCGIIMYVAVNGYRYSKDSIGKYIFIFTGVPVFIICGFEHAIADMCYFIFTVCSMQDMLRAAYITIIVTLANTVGAIFANWILNYELTPSDNRNTIQK